MQGRRDAKRAASRQAPGRPLGALQRRAQLVGEPRVLPQEFPGRFQILKNPAHLVEVGHVVSLV